MVSSLLSFSRVIHMRGSPPRPSLAGAVSSELPRLSDCRTKFSRLANKRFGVRNTALPWYRWSFKVELGKSRQK